MPSFTLKADGNDQKIAGSDFDSIAVTASGSDTVQVVRKLKGKTLSSIKDAVSSDGKVMRQEETNYAGIQPIVIKSEFKRVGAAAAGADAFSGSWLQWKVDSVSESCH